MNRIGRHRLLVAAVAIAALLVAAALASTAGASRARSAGSSYLGLATSGTARAQSTWHDHRSRRKHGDPHWYDEKLNDRDTYPLATIWGIVPLFESIDYIQITQPSAKNKRAVDRFAHGAEKYWDPGLRPRGGYAPYPSDRGQPEAWFDDNGWWGLAFFDAWRATHESRYLTDAARAFNYSLAAGWDPKAGGLWWNTTHPFKAGEAMAGNALLGARLYAQTHNAAYLSGAERLIGWATQNLWESKDQLYAKSSVDPTPMPYVEGPFIEAHEVICQATGDQSYCQAARTLADRAYNRFYNPYAELNMGPQYDTIYLRVMLDYAQATGDPRWLPLAKHEADRALANARVGDLYLKAWNGDDMSRHQADPGMLRTDAGTVDLFASLASAGA